MGSMRPEALFLSSSTSRYGSAQLPLGRRNQETLGPGKDGREGDRISAQETALGPTVPLPNPQQVTDRQTRAHIHVPHPPAAFPSQGEAVSLIQQRDWPFTEPHTFLP